MLTYADRRAPPEANAKVEELKHLAAEAQRELACKTAELRQVLTYADVC
jgi:hypothetical protein